MTMRVLAIVLVSCMCLAAPQIDARQGAAGRQAYEVWVVDQSDSRGTDHGGTLYYAWVMDRHRDVIEVLATKDDAHVGTIALNGPLTSNAAPDLTDTSPAGDSVFVALRGPTPLSGDPHNATGATPGLGIIEVTGGGRSGRLRAIVRLTNVGADGVERADPHGLRVRRLR